MCRKLITGVSIMKILYIIMLLIAKREAII